MGSQRPAPRRRLERRSVFDVGGPACQAALTARNSRKCRRAAFLQDALEVSGRTVWTHLACEDRSSSMRAGFNKSFHHAAQPKTLPKSRPMGEWQVVGA